MKLIISTFLIIFYFHSLSALNEVASIYPIDSDQIQTSSIYIQDNTDSKLKIDTVDEVYAPVVEPESCYSTCQIVHEDSCEIPEPCFETCGCEDLSGLASGGGGGYGGGGWGGGWGWGGGGGGGVGFFDDDDEGCNDKHCPPDVPVPEPSTYLIFGTLLAVLAFAYRRKRKTNLLP